MKTVPTLTIEYSLQFDIERVIITLKKMPWYRQNGYMPDVPPHVSEDSSTEEIKKAVEALYSEEEYKKYELAVLEKWSEYAPTLERALLSLPVEFRPAYTIRVTRYGTNGSYFPETSEIILNRTRRGKDEVLGTLLHEMIHIGIESLIQKYNVSHWRKERLVDLIEDKEFPGLRKMQNIEEDASVVDAAFASLYPDIEHVIKLIGSAA